MNQKMTPEELEQFIHRELRSLPPRRAPRSLEARVLAALDQQARVPWYHRSWSYWPAAVRAAFLATATGLSAAFFVALHFAGRAPETAALSQQVGHRFQLFSQLYAFGAWTVDYAGRTLGSVPPLWLYGGIAVVVALYATFFGLGAVAYRTLYQHD